VENKKHKSDMLMGKTCRKPRVVQTKQNPLSKQLM